MSGDVNERRTRVSRLAAALSLAALLALAGAASAGGGPHDEERPPGGLISRNAARLGLEGDSLAAVQAVIHASGARHADLLAKLDTARDAMRELLSQPVPDSKAVMAQADAIGAVETELHKNRLQAIMQIRALLTPEQRNMLLQIRDEEHARREREGGECEGHPQAAPIPTR
jgi:Spy/CpxP family protein refolding chaperone